MSRTPPARLLLLPFAAFLVVLPLILNGCSCGHDFTFHLSSWLDAAQQIRHGTLLPHWTISAAWNSGEPRFVFYPPLSWLLGAVLTLVFTPTAAPILFTWIALTAAAFTMYRLARGFTTSPIALLAATLYIVNPYMLFTAYERTAYGELLAAAWLPLLVAAALATRPRVTSIAIPIALLWLTNAPAAVIGCYAFAVIIAVRLFFSVYQRLPVQKEYAEAAERESKFSKPVSALPVTHALLGKKDITVPWYSVWLPPPAEPEGYMLLVIAVFGSFLGLALAGFYLIPAAYERRFVQIEMAIIPNMRFQDNFLFGHTADTPHNVVLHTASLIALTLLALTLLLLILLFLSSRKNAVILSGARSAQSKDTEALNAAAAASPFFTTTPIAVATLTLLIAFCLTPLSSPLWAHLPELAFLQFPWRLLSLLGVVFALAVALLINEFSTSGGPFIGWLHRAMNGVATPLAVTTLTLAAAFLCIHLFRQPCELADQPATHAQLFATSHGASPTDEYTPTTADNDVLRTDNPAYWLADDPQAFALNTIPNPAATIINYDEPPPLDQTVSTPAPHNIALNLPKSETLTLNLRDFPSWSITRNGELITARIQRDDGLIALPLPAGRSTISVAWHRTLDQTLGLSLTTLALLILGILSIHSYRAHYAHPSA